MSYNTPNMEPCNVPYRASAHAKIDADAVPCASAIAVPALVAHTVPLVFAVAVAKSWIGGSGLVQMFYYQ